MSTPEMDLSTFQAPMGTRRQRRIAGVAFIPLAELIGDIADHATSEHVLRSGEYVGRHRKDGE